MSLKADVCFWDQCFIKVENLLTTRRNARMLHIVGPIASFLGQKWTDFWPRSGLQVHLNLIQTKKTLSASQSCIKYTYVFTRWQSRRWKLLHFVLPSNCPFDHETQRVALREPDTDALEGGEQWEHFFQGRLFWPAAWWAEPRLATCSLLGPWHAATVVRIKAEFTLEHWAGRHGVAKTNCRVGEVCGFGLRLVCRPEDV